jgi:hypothetical protein
MGDGNVRRQSAMTHSSSPLTLTLRLVCAKRPSEMCEGKPTVFGLQDKKRTLLPGELEANGALRFDFEANANAEGTDGVRLTGPYVHGSPADRYLYLGWRPLDGPDDAWIRRWKISLMGISRAIIDGLADGEGLMLRVGEAGRGKIWIDGENWTTF